jgi:hypothetical protein
VFTLSFIRPSTPSLHLVPSINFSQYFVLIRQCSSTHHFFLVVFFSFLPLRRRFPSFAVPSFAIIQSLIDAALPLSQSLFVHWNLVVDLSFDMLPSPFNSRPA